MDFIQAINIDGFTIVKPLIFTDGQYTYTPFGEKQVVLGVYIGGVGYNIVNDKLITIDELVLAYEGMKIKDVLYTSYSAAERVITFSLEDLKRKDFVYCPAPAVVQSGLNKFDFDLTFYYRNVLEVVDVQKSFYFDLDGKRFVFIEGFIPNLTHSDGTVTGFVFPFEVGDLLMHNFVHNSDPAQIISTDVVVDFDGNQVYSYKRQTLSFLDPVPTSLQFSSFYIFKTPNT